MVYKTGFPTAIATDQWLIKPFTLTYPPNKALRCPDTALKSMWLSQTGVGTRCSLIRCPHRKWLDINNRNTIYISIERLRFSHSTAYRKDQGT